MEKHNHQTHSHSTSSNTQRIGIAFILNFVFTIIELIGGMLTNSMAIISDAIHDFGDSLSLWLAYYFQRLSDKDSNKTFTYGYKRFSLIGAIINSILLIIGSIIILTNAIPRLLHPEQTNVKGMFIIAIIGIIVNGFATFKLLKKNDNINERIVSLHLLEDTLGWTAILIGSVIIYFTEWTIIDPILSILISIYILLNVIKNLKDISRIILQATPKNVDTNHIIKKLHNFNEIYNIHDIHIWSMNENYNIMTIHIVLNENTTIHKQTELKHKIREALKEENITHITIEFDMQWEYCDMKNCTQSITK